MNVVKAYYNGNCVMTVDMDYVDSDSTKEYLQEILGSFKEKAFEEFDLENRCKTEIEKIWKGNENLYELKNQVEQKIEQEVEVDCFEKLFEKVEQLFCIMKEKLNDDEFELFKKLRSEEVNFYNNFDLNFYAGDGCLDYVWVEKNGKKDYKF